MANSATKSPGSAQSIAAVLRLEDARSAIGKMLAAAESRVTPEGRICGSVAGDSEGLVREIATAVMRHCPGLTVQIGDSHLGSNERKAVTAWWQENREATGPQRETARQPSAVEPGFMLPMPGGAA